MELRLCDSPEGLRPPGCATTIPSGRDRATALDVVVELHPPGCARGHGSMVPGPSDTPSEGVVHSPSSTAAEPGEPRLRAVGDHPSTGWGRRRSTPCATRRPRPGTPLHPPGPPLERPVETTPIRTVGSSNSSACRVPSACRATTPSGARNVTAAGTARSTGERRPVRWDEAPVHPGTTTPARSRPRAGVGAGRLRRSRRPPAARTTSRAGGTSARSPSTCARACRSRRG